MCVYLIFKSLSVIKGDKIFWQFWKVKISNIRHRLNNCDSIRDVIFYWHSFYMRSTYLYTGRRSRLIRGNFPNIPRSVERKSDCDKSIGWSMEIGNRCVNRICDFLQWNRERSVHNDFRHSAFFFKVFLSEQNVFWENFRNFILRIVKKYVFKHIKYIFVISLLYWLI